MRLLPRVALFIAVVALGVAAIGYAAERLLQRRTGQSWLLNGWNDLGPVVHDPLLGWTSPPSTNWSDLYGPARDCSFNARGFRATEEYADRSPEDRTRVLLLGDSFMAGLGLRDSATISAQLQEIRPDVQAVNMAKISYGLDQAVLRYERDGERMQAAFAVLTAIDDNLNRARWDHFFAYWPKPRFAVEEQGGLRLTGTPVPDFSAPIETATDLWRRSGLYLLIRQYIAEKTYAQDDRELAVRILDRYRRIAKERSQGTMLVYFPTLPEVESGVPLPLSTVLEGYARENDLPFVDIAETFAGLEEAERPRCFLKVNEHYSEYGSRLVAEALAQALPAVD